MKKRLYSELDEREVTDNDTRPPRVYIHNIVSTTKIESSGPNLNLEKLGALLPSSHYDRNRFAAITIRIGNPNRTALLFTSGKLVVTGGVCWYECLLAATEITRMIQRCMPDQRFWNVSCDIQNIVAKSTVVTGPGEYLDIEQMYHSMNNLCTYQKSMFPGLIYRPRKSPIVLLCFQSGKVVITGGRRETDVYLGWKVLWSHVRRFVVIKNND